MNKYVIITEHWRKAGESVDIVALKNGNNLAVHIKDGAAIIFSSIYDLALYQMAGVDINRVYCSENQLENIYATFSSYFQLERRALEGDGLEMTAAAGSTLREIEEQEEKLKRSKEEVKLYFQISYMAKMFGMTQLLYGTEAIYTTEYPTRNQLIEHVIKSTPNLDEKSISIMAIIPQTKEQWDNYHK